MSSPSNIDPAPLGERPSLETFIADREQLVFQQGRHDLAPELASAYLQRARAAGAADLRLTRACVQSASQLLEPLVRQGGRQDLARDLAIACWLNAEALSLLNEERAALVAWDECIALLEPLEEGEPMRCENLLVGADGTFTMNRPQPREVPALLACAYCNKAGALERLGEKAAVASTLDKAIFLYQRLVHIEQRDDLARELAETCMARASYALAEGDLPKVATLYDWVVDARTRPLLRDRQAGQAAELAAAHNDRGYVRHLLEQYSEALSDYDRALELDPANAVLCMNRSATLAALKRYEEALAGATSAVHLKPGAATYASRGALLGEMGRYQEAVADLREALRLDPQLGRAHGNMGIVLSDNGDLTAALPHLDKAARLGHADLAERARQIRVKLAIDAGETGWNEAHERVSQAQSASDLREALSRFPFMLLAEFTDSVRVMIQPDQEPAINHHLEERLDWLRQAAEEARL